MKHLLLIAAVLVVIANAFIFARVAYNRSGEPQTVTLTERELSIPYNYFRNKGENSGLSLHVNWRTAGHNSWKYYYGVNHDLPANEEKLRALGFRPPENCGGIQETYGGRDKSRKAWAALEYDGPAHARYISALEKHFAKRNREIGGVDAEAERAELKRIKDQLQDAREYDSRLYVVDVSLEKEPLSAQYSDQSRYLIIAAEIRNSSYCEKTEPVLKIDVTELLPVAINVPRQYHAFFEQLPERLVSSAKQLPRYQVKIAFGKLNEPWLVEVTE